MCRSDLREILLRGQGRGVITVLQMGFAGKQAVEHSGAKGRLGLTGTKSVRKVCNCIHCIQSESLVEMAQTKMPSYVSKTVIRCSVSLPISR